jgi:hypothetical protein
VDSMAEMWRAGWLLEYVSWCVVEGVGWNPWLDK